MISHHSGPDSIIDIKTNNIYLTIKRRKKPDLVSEILLHQKSKLEVWGTLVDLTLEGKQVSLSANSDYTRIEVVPLFFEQSDYIVNAKTLNGAPLHFDHINKAIKESVCISFDDTSMLSGTINFGNEVGYSNLVFFDEQGNRLLLEVEVFPSKLSYKEDYENIRNEINEMAEAAAVDFINSTYVSGTTVISRNDVPAIFFALICQLFEKYYKAVCMIMSNPNHKLITERAVLPTYKITRSDCKTGAWIERHPEKAKRKNGEIQITSALAVQKKITYDTTENQIVKFMLSSTVDKLMSFQERYRSGRTDPSIMNRTSLMIDKIKSQLRNPVFQGVSPLKSIETMSLVFQMAPGYRELYKIFQILQRGISFNGEVFNLSLKDTSTLYEYWCFIKLVNIMKKHFTMLDEGSDIIKTDKKGITVTLSKGKRSSVSFLDTRTGDKFELLYNPGSYPSETVAQIPDNVLSLKKNTCSGTEIERYQYVFDAKYKVEMNPDDHYPDSNPGPKVEDINTMHRYRDAIVANTGGLNKKLMFGAYILFPYPGSEGEYRKHKFYESIEKVNIGGLPFLPKKTELAEELLLRLVSESNESAFERSILPEGIETRLAKVDWETRDVLVGSLSSREQFDVILREKYYYVPIISMPTELHRISYVALYQSLRLHGRDAGILYYGEVISSEIRKRKSINNYPGRTRPDELCFYYVIEEWKKLNKRIEFEEEWVYKPRFTNFFLLNNCYKTFELFNIRTEEEFRLVYELRRIQKRIQIKDNANDLFIKFNNSISIYSDKQNIYVFYNKKKISTKPTSVFSKYPSSVFKDIRDLIDQYQDN